MFVRNNASASITLIYLPGFNTEVANAVPSRNMTSYVTIIPEGNSLDGSFGIIGLPDVSETIPVGNFS